MHFNSIPPSTPGSSKCLPQVSTLRTRILLFCLPYELHVPPISFFLFDQWSNICWGVQIIKLNFMCSSPLSCFLVPLRPNIFPICLILSILGLCFSPRTRDQVSHSYKTTGKIIVLDNFIFLDAQLGDKRFNIHWKFSWYFSVLPRT